MTVKVEPISQLYFCPISYGFYFRNNIFGDELHSKLVSEKLTFPWQVQKFVHIRRVHIPPTNLIYSFYEWCKYISPFWKRGKEGGQIKGFQQEHCIFVQLDLLENNDASKCFFRIPGLNGGLSKVNKLSNFDQFPFRT